MCICLNQILDVLAGWGFKTDKPRNLVEFVQSFSTLKQPGIAYASLNCYAVYQGGRACNAKIHGQPHETPTMMTATILEALTWTNAYPKSNGAPTNWIGCLHNFFGSSPWSSTYYYIPVHLLDPHIILKIITHTGSSRYKYHNQFLQSSYHLLFNAPIINLLYTIIDINNLLLMLVCLHLM